MNKADNEAGSKAIDSLINFETVKVGACISCMNQLRMDVDNMYEVYVVLVILKHFLLWLINTLGSLPAVFQQ